MSGDLYQLFPFTPTLSTVSCKWPHLTLLSAAASRFSQPRCVRCMHTCISRSNFPRLYLYFFRRHHMSSLATFFDQAHARTHVHTLLKITSNAPVRFFFAWYRCACYYRAYDEPTDRSVLLLEDLKARPGEYERDQIEGCTPAEAKVVVTALAKLHAYFYNRGRAMAPFARSLVGSALTPRVATKNGRKEEEGGGDSFDQTLDQLRSALPDLRRAAAVLGHGPDSPSMRAVELLMSGENMRDLYAAMAPRDEGGESDGTLMWGDARADNVIFFRGDGGELSCVLIDWQLARSGPGECDLALFISTSLPRERRRELAVPLLRVYHTELVAALIARGSIKELPTFEAVLCNFQRGLLFNARVLPLAANGFNGAASESKRGEALLRSIVVGHLEALEAWDAHGWLTSLSQRRRAARGSVDRTTAPNEDARLLPPWVRAAAAASSETSKL